MSVPGLDDVSFCTIVHPNNGASFVGGCSQVRELQRGTKENAVCSNRGVCDRATGLCKCFRGFSRHDCSVVEGLTDGSESEGGHTEYHYIEGYT